MEKKRYNVFCNIFNEELKMQQLKDKFSIKEYINKNKDLLLLLYWPLYGIVFWSMEFWEGRVYHPVVSVLDGYIPFSAWWVVPYFFWFVYIIGNIAWFFFKDRPALAKYMWFVIITHSIIAVVYFVYPTSQLLRPEVTEKGFFYDVVRWLYGYDTNTNVCPSIHVAGSFAVMFAALSAKSIKSRWVKVLYVIAAVMICASTVFLKQHSIVDVWWGVILSAAVYPFVFCRNKYSRALLKCAHISE